jgi:hypothetical protein
MQPISTFSDLQSQRAVISVIYFHDVLLQILPALNLSDTPLKFCIMFVTS